MLRSRAPLSAQSRRSVIATVRTRARVKPPSVRGAAFQRSGAAHQRARPPRPKPREHRGDTRRQCHPNKRWWSGSATASKLRHQIIGMDHSRRRNLDARRLQNSSSPRVAGVDEGESALGEIEMATRCQARCDRPNATTVGARESLSNRRNEGAKLIRCNRHADNRAPDRMMLWRPQKPGDMQDGGRRYQGGAERHPKCGLCSSVISAVAPSELQIACPGEIEGLRQESRRDNVRLRQNDRGVPLLCHHPDVVICWLFPAQRLLRGCCAGHQAQDREKDH